MIRLGMYMTATLFKGSIEIMMRMTALQDSYDYSGDVWGDLEAFKMNAYLFSEKKKIETIEDCQAGRDPECIS